uniref:Uncharacterized protein n=1 Tax=Arundo donax TaxID=35708 RepID=A0A0A8XZY0_ARUDO
MRHDILEALSFSRSMSVTNNLFHHAYWEECFQGLSHSFEPDMPTPQSYYFLDVFPSNWHMIAPSCHQSLLDI